MRLRADGTTNPSEPIVLAAREIEGGVRKLVFTECSEYLTVDVKNGAVTRAQTFDEKDFMRAAADFRGAACAF